MGASQSLNVKKASTTRTVDSPEQRYLQSIHKDDSLEPFLLQTLDYLYVPLILKEKSKKQYALVCIRHELVVHMMLQDCLKQQFYFANHPDYLDKPTPGKEDSLGNCVLANDVDYLDPCFMQSK